jgi:UDPglucose 6-dehydrogenase
MSRPGGGGAAGRAPRRGAAHEAARHFSDLLAEGSLRLCDIGYDCLPDADALLVLTEWHEYRTPDFGRIREMLREPVVFDGRNLWEPARMAGSGFEYVSIGRPSASAVASGAPAGVAD